jgi:hypothetical protein
MVAHRTGVALAVVLGAVVAACVCYHFFWIERTAVAAKSMLVWPERSQAAGFGRTTSIGQIVKGETVDVLWDRYGKDYWACYVRTRSGGKGWVLCTDL